MYFFLSLRLGLRLVFAQSADTILINGKIITVDDKFRTVQAVAIQRDRIVAAGGNDEIQKLKGPATQLIDVQGRTVIPGSALELTRVSGRQRQ